MADARGLGPRGVTLAGSSPVSPTIFGKCKPSRSAAQVTAEAKKKRKPLRIHEISSKLPKDEEKSDRKPGRSQSRLPDLGGKARAVSSTP